MTTPSCAFHALNIFFIIKSSKGCTADQAETKYLLNYSLPKKKNIKQLLLKRLFKPSSSNPQFFFFF